MNKFTATAIKTIKIEKYFASRQRVNIIFYFSVKKIDLSNFKIPT